MKNKNCNQITKTLDRRYKTWFNKETGGRGNPSGQKFNYFLIKFLRKSISRIIHYRKTHKWTLHYNFHT